MILAPLKSVNVDTLIVNVAKSEWFLPKGGSGEVVSIMLVEDHRLLRQALAVLFDGEPDLRVVAQAGSLAEAREQATILEDLIHIAVVDFSLPDGNATQLIAELHQTLPGVKVLVFTASLDPETAQRALAAGANATLHKTAGKAEILAAVRRLLED